MSILGVSQVAKPRLRVMKLQNYKRISRCLRRILKIIVFPLKPELSCLSDTGKHPSFGTGWAGEGTASGRQCLSGLLQNRCLNSMGKVVP